MIIIQMFVPLFSSTVGWKDMVLPHGLWAADVGRVVPVHGSSPWRCVAEPVGGKGSWNLWLVVSCASCSHLLGGAASG